MAPPKLSICIPTLNRAQSLARTLESLSSVDQLGFPVEIVVCDNASTDGTADVVRAMAGRFAALKYCRQRRTVDIVANHAAAFRAATGIYSLFLADDDRLELPPLLEIVDFLDREGDIVACFTGWYEWDDCRKKNTGTWDQVKQVKIFDSASSYQLFDFVINRHIFPEIGVFRTDVLNRVRFLANKTWEFHWWMCRCLDYGRICFHPKVYYKNVVVFESGQQNRGRTGNRLSMEIIDEYRAAAEIVLASAVRDHGHRSIGAEKRVAALEMVNRFVNSRLLVAARLCRGQKDYVSALEYFSRYLLWTKSDKPPVDEFRSVIPLAAAQTIVALFDSTAGVQRLAVCGFADPERPVNALRAIRRDLPLRTTTVEEICADPGRLEDLVLVETPADRERLTSGGIPSGRILCFEEACEHFSFDPRPARFPAGAPGQSSTRAALAPPAARAAWAAPLSEGPTVSGVCRLEDIVSS